MPNDLKASHQRLQKLLHAPYLIRRIHHLSDELVSYHQQTINSMSKAGQNYEYATHNLWDLCFRGDLKAARKALDRGIDANVRNKTGWTPLHAACSGNHVKLIELLLRAGGDLDATDNGGRSAMHEASKSGSLAAVKALQKAGARMDAKDNKGQLPRDVAKGDGIRNYLQSFSTAVDKKNGRDSTASDSTGGASELGQCEQDDGPSVRDRSKGRSFARGDDGCCRSVRKVRYSTKQKKEIIKERRRKQREEAAAEDCGVPETKNSNNNPSYDNDSLEGQKVSIARTVGSWRCSVKGGHASGRGLGLVPWQHDDGLEWTAPLRLPLGASSGKGETMREPDRLCEASTGLPVASEAEAGHGDGPNQQQPVILRRPAWQGRAATKEELHQLEEEAWGDWIDGLEAADKASGRRLNFFETSLSRWRMLWVSAEKADVAVMVVDARYPLLHFSSDMHEYLVNDLHKRVVIVMTKADLTPRAAVEAWTTYLSRRFPDICGVVAICTHSQDPEQAKKLCAMLLQCTGSVGGGQGEGECPSDASDAGGACDVPAEEPAKHVVVLGDANVGKSSLVNFLLQRKAVATSANPNTTKVLQTHHLQRDGHAFVLYDLPATTAPRAGIPKPLEVLFGTYPVSQCPDPYSCLRYLAEHCKTPLQQAYQLTDAAHSSSAPAESDSPDIPFDQDGVEEGDKVLESNGGSHTSRNAEPDASQCSTGDGDSDGDGNGDDGDDDGDAAHLGLQAAAAGERPLTTGTTLRHGTEPASVTESAGSWSPYGLAAAFASKMKWYLRRRGEPDTFRAANCMLKDAIKGRPVLLAFWPPPLLPITDDVNDSSRASNDDDDPWDEKAAPIKANGGGRHHHYQLLLLLPGAGMDSSAAPSTSSDIVD